MTYNGEVGRGVIGVIDVTELMVGKSFLNRCLAVLFLLMLSCIKDLKEFLHACKEISLQA